MSKNGKGELPLHLACKYYNHHEQSKTALKILKFLVSEAPKSVTANNWNGNLPIHIAIGNRAGLKAIQYLHAQYPDSIKRSTDEGLVGLHVACQVKSSLKVIQFLVEKWKGGLEATTNDGRLPLHIACDKHLSLETIQFLVQQLASFLSVTEAECLDIKDSKQQTSLDKAKAAAKNGNSPIVQWMEQVIRGDEGDGVDSNTGSGGISKGEASIETSIQEEDESDDDELYDEA